MGLFRLEEAEEMYRRKQLTTTYQYHHGYSLHKPKKGNIFEFKTLQKVLNLIIVARFGQTSDPDYRNIHRQLAQIRR